MLQGIDLFDMPYLTEVTAGGYALCFPLSPEEDPAAPAPANSVAGRPVAPAGGAAGSTGSDSGAGGVSSRASTGADDTKLNLWALAYRTDARPLVPGCGCFACKHHTRAYLHHLLHAHEMLAQVGGLWRRDAWVATNLLAWLCVGWHDGWRQQQRPSTWVAPTWRSQKDAAVFSPGGQGGPYATRPTAPPNLINQASKQTKPTLQARSPCARCCWRCTTATTTCAGLRSCGGRWRQGGSRHTASGSYSAGSAQRWVRRAWALLPSWLDCT